MESGLIFFRISCHLPLATLRVSFGTMEVTPPILQGGSKNDM